MTDEKTPPTVNAFRGYGGVALAAFVLHDVHGDTMTASIDGEEVEIAVEVAHGPGSIGLSPDRARALAWWLIEAAARIDGGKP